MLVVNDALLVIIPRQMALKSGGTQLWWVAPNHFYGRVAVYMARWPIKVPKMCSGVGGGSDL